MRCYFVYNDHFRSVEILTETSDQAAILEARELFEERKDDFEGFEVWDSKRLVYKHPGPMPKFMVDPGRTPTGAPGTRT